MRELSCKLYLTRTRTFAWALPVMYVIVLHCSKSGSGRWPVAYSGKVSGAWISTSFFLQAAHVRMRGARTSVLRGTYVHFGRAIGAAVGVSRPVLCRGVQ